MREYPHAADGLAALLARDRLTVAALSRTTDIPELYLRHVLSGTQTTISTRNLFQLAQAFRMPMAELIDFFSIPASHGS
jgi:predicted transcriptional regulator